MDNRGKHLVDTSNHPANRAIVDHNGDEWVSATYAAKQHSISTSTATKRATRQSMGWHWSNEPLIVALVSAKDQTKPIMYRGVWLTRTNSVLGITQ